jgi:hypothetical protein
MVFLSSPGRRKGSPALASPTMNRTIRSKNAQFARSHALRGRRAARSEPSPAKEFVRRGERRHGGMTSQSGRELVEQAVLLARDGRCRGGRAHGREEGADGFVGGSGGAG